jgi:hypothetical protein
MHIQDMLAYNFDDNEWVKVKFAGASVNFFAQGAACTVLPKKSKDFYYIRKVSHNHVVKLSFRVTKSLREFTTSAVNLSRATS